MKTLLALCFGLTLWLLAALTLLKLVVGWLSWLFG